MKMNKMIFEKKFNSLRGMIFACGTFIGCFVIAITLLEPYLHPSLYNFSEQFEVEIPAKNPRVINLSSLRSDVYDIIGDVRIHTNSSTIFIGISSKSQQGTDALTSWTVKPFTRKLDPIGMRKISPLRVRYATYARDNNVTSSVVTMPKYCNKILATTLDATPTAATPAIIFSTSGYTGNAFHDFDDVLLPLYSTARQFNRSVLFLVTDPKPIWLSKYKLVLRELSRYDVVEIRGDDDRLFCFDRVIVGLKTDKDREFIVDDATVMTNFTKMLRSAYSLPRREFVPVARPRMLIVSRRVSRRRLVNERAVGDMARDLGFEVVIEEMSNDMSEVARLVNSVDVMVGVHGAGLTNMVFLPENASLVQIIPFGLVNFARFSYQNPSSSMKLRYSDYAAGLNESTLPEKYSGTEVNYTDPEGMLAEKGFFYFRKVYLDNQNVNLDVARFRTTLIKISERFGL